MRRLLFQLILSMFTMHGAMATSELDVTVMNYRTENGLANNDVQFSFQDHQGYIWIGTRGGISRFDGYNFYNHYPDPTRKNYFATGNFTSYLQWTDSTYYLGTLSDGLFILNTEANKIRKVKNAPKSVTCIFKQDAKTLWLGTLADGFYSYDVSKSKAKQYLLKPLAGNFTTDWNNNTIDAIGMDAKNPQRLWLGCRSGLHSLDIRSKKIIPYIIKTGQTEMHITSVNQIKSLYFDQKGAIWVGTFFGGLAKFNIQTKQWKRYLYNPTNFEQNVLSDNIILNILPYKQNYLLLSTSAGPMLFQPENERFTKYNLFSAEKKLIGDVVHLYVDKHENIWVSQVYQQGLSVISKSFNAIKKIDLPIQKNYSDYYSSALTDLYFSKRYNSYFATISNYDGIVEYSPNFQLKKKFNLPSYWENKEPFSTSIAEDNNGNLWITDISGKLLKLNYHNGKVEIQPSENLGYCMKIIRNSTTSILLHAENGIFQLHGNKWIQLLPPADAISKNVVNNQLIFCKKRKLYSYHLLTKKSTYLTTLPIFCTENANYIHELYLDSKHRIWIPLERGGVYRYDRKTKHLNFYNSKDGLSINETRRISEDRKGRTFLLCYGGIYYFNANLNRFEDFNALMMNSSSNWNEFFITMNNHDKLMLSKQNALYEIDQDLVLNYSLNLPRITSLKIGKDQYFNLGNHFEIPNHQNTVEIYFSNFDYSHLNELIYEYQLTGQKSWIRLEKGRNNVSLSNLPEGNYTLKYRIAGHSNFSSFKFSITEVWYKSRNFYIITGSILLLLAIILIYYTWNKQLVKRQLERKVVEFKLKALQSQLNPHFLFNCLTSISGLVKMGEYMRAEKTLHDFAKLMRKILMFSDQESIPLKDEIELSVLYLNIEKMRKDELFNYSIEMDEQLNQFKVPPMTLQPFLENCVKHAFAEMDAKGSGKIEIQCYTENGTLILQIRDNGRGFPEHKNMDDEQHRSKGIEIQETRLTEFFKMNNKKVHLSMKNRTEGGAEVRIEIQL